MQTRETERVLNQTTRNVSHYGRRNRAPTAEQVVNAAQTLASASGLSCDVSEATQIGVTDGGQETYEAACATGTGYILVGSTPPQQFDCIELKAQADLIRARDPDADVGQQCKIERNLDVTGALGGYAIAAGVDCAVDEGRLLGKSDDGNIAYEVGCKAAPGYWLERRATGWHATECLEVASTGGLCQFTTAEEEAASLQSKLADTGASRCEVQAVRLVGLHANGRVYEAKCSTGEGFIALLKDGVAQQVLACSTAQGVAGGCKLTPPAVAAQDSPPRP